MDSDQESSEVRGKERHIDLFDASSSLSLTELVSTVLGSTRSGRFEFLSMYMLLPSTRTSSSMRLLHRVPRSKTRFADSVGIAFERTRMVSVLPVDRYASEENHGDPALLLALV